jgi:hypothetical protein
MPGFNNGVMWANNVRFDGTQYPGQVTTDGQLLIGSTASPNIKVGTLTATAGQGISVTPGSGSITVAGIDSTTAVKGVVQLATNAEVQLGVDTAKAIVPSSFSNYMSDLTFSGFVSWTGAGAYFDDTTLGTFSLLRGGTGYIKGKLVSFAGAQSVTGMATGNSYWICIDSAGVLQKYDTFSDAIFTDHIPLFECLRDSTPVTNNQTTVKENHPYNFAPIISIYNHNTIGCIIQNSSGGANITLNGTQKIQINGDDVLSDHGLYTTIPDSAGVGVTWRKFYTTAGGKWALYTNTDTFTGHYNNAGTVTVLSAGRFGIYTLYASKDSLNTTTPTYFAILDTSQYTSLPNANTAIANGTTAKATNELANLEIVQLGYIVFSQTTNRIVQVTISKSTLKQTLSTSGTNIASLVTTSVGAFNGWLSATDTNVQSALDTLDNTPFATNSGTASPAAGTLTVQGGTSTGGAATNINTIGSGATLSVCLNNSISQPRTNAAGTTGMYSLGGDRFLHNYSVGVNDANTFLGGLSGNLALTGIRNTGLGNNNLSSLTSGQYNLSAGQASSNTLSTGSFNVTLGAASAQNINGSYNVAIGHEALYGAGGATPSYCIAIGQETLKAATTCQGNTIVGWNSAPLITTGGGNEVLGQQCLQSLTTGLGNICIGYPSGNAYNGAEASNFCVRNTGVVGESNTIRIGTQGAAAYQSNRCFVAGIASVVNSNKNIVTIDTTTGQLGSQSISSSTLWTTINANQTAAVGNGYFCNKAGTLALALPAASAVGDVIEVANINTAAGVQFTQAANQQIFIAGGSSTLGAAGTLTSTAVGDTLKMVCRTANLVWQVVSSIGTWTPA